MTFTFTAAIQTFCDLNQPLALVGQSELVTLTVVNYGVLVPLEVHLDKAGN